jgi:hypothetical protein
MPHRIKWLSRAHYQDPLIDYGSTEFILDFEDAASLLQQWRNPHLGRSSREGTVLSIAANAKMSLENIRTKLLTTSIVKEEEEHLLEQLKIYTFMLDRTLPQALELVNLDKLLTPEDILKFIQKHLAMMEQEYGQKLTFAGKLLSQLEEITDIEIRDQFGRRKKIHRNDLLDVLGRALGVMLIRQASLRPVDKIDVKPMGKIKAKHTYRAAMMRTMSIPPKDVSERDIRVVDKDRLSLIYFIVDVSQSMGKNVFTGGLTRLDGALLTGLGLYYFFNMTNRRKRREYDSFKMHLVPVVELPYTIEDKAKLEQFLFEAEAKGRTRLVHALHNVVNHVKDHQKGNDFDVQIIVLTDGKPNVPFEGKIPGFKDKRLSEYFDKSNTKTGEDTKECMIQLNQYFNHLRMSKDREWNISYFLMAKEKLRTTDLYLDTVEMLKGIARPILIDPTKVDQLGSKIIQEALQ